MIAIDTVELVKLYKQGTPTKELSRLFFVSIPTVQRALKRCGVKLRRAGRPKLTDKPMSRYDRFKHMSIDELAALIIKHGMTDEFCKSDCGNDEECHYDKECCKKWLMEKVE